MVIEPVGELTWSVVLNSNLYWLPIACGTEDPFLALVSGSFLILFSVRLPHSASELSFLVPQMSCVTSQPSIVSTLPPETLTPAFKAQIQ